MRFCPCLHPRQPTAQQMPVFHDHTADPVHALFLDRPLIIPLENLIMWNVGDICIVNSEVSRTLLSNK